MILMQLVLSGHFCGEICRFQCVSWVSSLGCVFWEAFSARSFGNECRFWAQPSLFRNALAPVLARATTCPCEFFKLFPRPCRCSSALSASVHSASATGSVSCSVLSLSAATKSAATSSALRRHCPHATLLRPASYLRDETKLNHTRSTFKTLD